MKARDIARKPYKKKRGNFPGHYIRQWREHRGLTQEYLAARIDLEQATISRLERGDIAYTQPVLEAIAEVLRCSPADLIMRSPGAIDGLRDMLTSLSEDEQKRAMAVIRALKDSEAA